MAETQVFVSHAPEDLDRVTEIVGPLRNLPIDLYIAGEEVDPDRGRKHLKRRMADSDLVVSVLTERAIEDYWVNQEIGYATAEEQTIVPLVADAVDQPGYVADIEAVDLDDDAPEVTVYDLLTRLRDELEPIGELTMPSWYVSFRCTRTNCREMVVLEIEQRQHELWKQYERGNTITATCDDCGAAYEFNPATLGYIERIDP